MNYKGEETGAARPGRPARDPRRLPRRWSPGGRHLLPAFLRQHDARGARWSPRSSGCGRASAPSPPTRSRANGASTSAPTRRSCQPMSSRSRRAISAGSSDGLRTSATRQLYVMQSNCGVETLGSDPGHPDHNGRIGPATGFWGAAELGQLIGEQNVLALDIGGTTAKCSLIEHGHVKITSDYWIERPAVLGLSHHGAGHRSGRDRQWRRLDRLDRRSRVPCMSVRKAPARCPVRRPMAAAAPMPPRPTPISCSAASTRTISAAARS